MRATKLSPHDFLLLDQWARLLGEAFGETPYLVGSAHGSDERPTFRDVDVRMLGDEWPLGPEMPDGARPRLRVVNMVVSMWGRQVTGLPIDFQFQPPDEFHDHDGQPRSALGIRSRIDARHLAEARDAAHAASSPRPTPGEQ